MRPIEISKTIHLPEDVQASLTGRTVSVKGPKGILSRSFAHAPILIEHKDKQIHLSVEWPRKKEAAMVGTVYSHIQNMIIGVRTGFVYKLKIVFSHFPIAVKPDGKSVRIENFTGERKARKAKIMGDVQIKVQSDDVIVQGINLEDVSQTAANIQTATKVKKKDPRIFLDGIYIYEKTTGAEK